MMEQQQQQQQQQEGGHVTRKRRAINACGGCRASKVRCDGQRPCARCTRNNTTCRYLENGSSTKDIVTATTLRLEKLEAEVESLRNIVSASSKHNAISDDIRRRRTDDTSAAPLIGVPVSTATAMDVDMELPTRRRDGSETVIASNTIPRAGRTQEVQSGFGLGPTPPQVMGFSPTSTTTVTTSTRTLHSLSGGDFAHLLAGDGGSSSSSATAVDKGLISWGQASFFFSGSHFLVPIFCERTDTLQSVATRSAYLFDSIVSIGCRAEEGSKSATYHRLSFCLREHLTRVLVSTTVPSLETVQAITLKAGYSDDGLVYLALALRFAMQLGLPDAVEQVVAKASSRGVGAPVGDEEKELYRLARVWHGICNMELFFSLDGGKSPGITLRISSRRVRLLVNHPERTAVDFRLLSQIELNIIRANAYTIIAQHHSSTSLASETQLRSTVQGTAVELALWLEEWSEIISLGTQSYKREFALLNLRIQYNWALITLHLKALSDSGIESIAIMTDFQRDMVRIAKEAAARHLHHLLETPRTSSSSLESDSPPPYLSVFKWTMDFVWAKCAFTVLLVLKLSLLLRDPLPDVLLLLRDAYRVLEELTRVTVSNSGNTSYLKILRTSIEKCESALREHMIREQQLSIDDVEREDGQAEDDFQGYVPSQFVFEWDFPGLNLRHVPLGWQDLFHDLDRVF
ncbi:hypothetical protein DM02DRAFT_673627 [Periconia macrospinosa]|uniref:Zn(2)-C6 fungal-type domain-containing protein n=1 Tax=Periconia macrospinosa TaxID=97972 RepID=A0A2V1DJ39_9PLEO|nr:hypothetical protein DM02DRAFT_673627 [Periconia macrospinosa]